MAWCVAALVLILVALVAPLATAAAPLVELSADAGRADLDGGVELRRAGTFAEGRDGADAADAADGPAVRGR